MPNLIIDLDIDRVDLVDEGANSASHIRMYKRKEHTNPMLTIEEILKSLKAEHRTVVEDAIEKAKVEATAAADADKKAKEKELEDAKEELAKAKADLATAEETVAKSKAPAEPDFEEVIKGLDPSIQTLMKSMKAQKEAAEAIAKAAADKELEDIAKSKAAELKSLPVDEAKLVEVVKGISPEVFEILKAANTAIEDGGLLDEVGVAKSKAKTTDAAGAEAAWDAIEKAAKEISAEQKVTIEKARTIAIKENPELYREYLKGDK